MNPGLVDACGTRHVPAGPDARIVCLVPSVTELLCALGLAARLVGRTGFCIHPRDTLRTIPKLGGTKDVDVDALLALQPTHVVVNIDENRRETAEQLAAAGLTVIVTHPCDPRDNAALYRLLGGIFGVGAAAERLCAELADALAEIAAGPPRPARRVLYLIWREPWMSVAPDTYIARTLALFNWHTLPTAPASRYPEVDPVALGQEADAILLSTEPYTFRERHVAELRALCGSRPAVRLIDGEMTSWYGVRAIAGLRYLDAFTRADAPGIAA